MLLLFFTQRCSGLDPDSAIQDFEVQCRAAVDAKLVTDDVYMELTKELLTLNLHIGRLQLKDLVTGSGPAKGAIDQLKAIADTINSISTSTRESIIASNPVLAEAQICSEKVCVGVDSYSLCEQSVQYNANITVCSG